MNTFGGTLGSTLSFRKNKNFTRKFPTFAAYINEEICGFACFFTR